MEYQVLFIKKMGEVTKKRKLSKLDDGISSNEYMCTIEDSTLTLDKNNDTIYYHDHDHTYAKNKAEIFTYEPINESPNNMMIDRVNDDCLAEIFTYVPLWERPKLTLVCKKWKRALDDSWFNVKKIKLTHWEYHEYPNCLKKYPTIDGEFSFLKSLLDKCGRYLTLLDLTAYGHCNIVPVINDYCPNLVKLRLRFTSIDDVLLFKAFTRLSKLKSLTIIFQNMEKEIIPVTLINSLINVAKTLTDLSLLNWVDDLKETPNFTKAIKNVVRHLKALKTLELAGVRVSLKLLKYLEKKRILYLNHSVHIGVTLLISEPLTNIRSLKITECRVKDETLYTIANTFKHLELLHIKSKWVTDDGVVALSKMNNLRYLYFAGHSPITDDSVKLFKNMTKLALPWSKKITDVSIMKVLENSPMIEALSVYGTNVTAELVKKAAEGSRIREQCLTFCVALMPDIKQYKSPYFDIRIKYKKNGKFRKVADASVHAGGELTKSLRGQAQIS